MNRIPLHAAVYALCALLIGCASFGLAPAQNFSSRLAYGYGAYAGVNNTIASSLDAHRISSKDAKEFRELATQARTLLDAAKFAYEAGDLADAQNRLTLALTVLEKLEAYLDRKAQP